ncbi:hypothetical protein DKG77_05625 [Flagellimonas aquimarina]|uniref:Uncharacterized protein n=1 Tax=Flagellimonas aquimarina TaxID=2201895 RepID=A0A316L358_9FLAO|nr:hypothetical protein DKG77_05625 [Allomuricauda koreensis]
MRIIPIQKIKKKFILMIPITQGYNLGRCWKSLNFLLWQIQPYTAYRIQIAENATINYSVCLATF